MNLQVINDNENNRQLVSGRELHEFLEVGTQYSKWIERMSEYGFDVNIDYIAISQKRLTAQGNETNYIDHQLTIEMAKEISMLQRTEKGKQARQYFIQLEKAWNSPEMIMKRANDILNKRVEDMQLKLKLNEPLVNFGRAVLNSDDAISFGSFSKLLFDKEQFRIGRNKLFEWMRKNGYLISQGREFNIPKQKYIEQGLFEIKESIQHTPAGDKITRTTLITGKGQIYFTQKLIEDYKRGIKLC